MIPLTIVGDSRAPAARIMNPLLLLPEILPRTIVASRASMVRNFDPGIDTEELKRNFPRSMSVAPTGAAAIAAFNPAVESVAPVASTAHLEEVTSIAMGSVTAQMDSGVAASAASALCGLPAVRAIDGAPQAAAVNMLRRDKIPMIPPGSWLTAHSRGIFMPGAIAGFIQARNG